MKYVIAALAFFAVIMAPVNNTVVQAHGPGDGDRTPITDAPDDGTGAPFDIVYADITRIGSSLYFQIVVDGEAGNEMPDVTGDLAGASVFSYVWPTSLDTALVGFEANAGILALAVTAHPDFDDTPLWDENNDGDLLNDGAEWHSHWVVLVPDDACEAGLKVQDIPEGESPAVPATWPELPILIDSPNYDLELTGSEIIVTVPHSELDFADNFSFDGVTAGLRVNGNLHSPLLCVTGIDDIASNDLSLPGISGNSYE